MKNRFALESCFELKELNQYLYNTRLGADMGKERLENLEFMHFPIVFS